MIKRYGQAANWILLAHFVAATLFALIVLPLWLLPISPWWALLLVPIALGSNSFWALNHEAIHGNFNWQRLVNHRAGRVMSVLLGSSFRVLRFAHLMHHRHNRYPLDRPDIYEPDDGPYAFAKVRFLSELLFLLYLSEAAVPLLCLLPKPGVKKVVDIVYRNPDPIVQEVRSVADQVFLRDRSLREIRIDAIAMICMVALAFFCYGTWWPILLAFLLSRGMIISFLDNIYHFGTPIDDATFAMNLRLPGPFRLAVLNMNMHRVHHHNPNLTWWELSTKFRQSGEYYDKSFFPTALAQFKGPIPTAVADTRMDSA
jgi:fatty acid desaturase